MSRDVGKQFGGNVGIRRVKGVAIICAWAMAFPAGLTAGQYGGATAATQQAPKSTSKQCEVNSSLTGPLIKARKLYRTGKLDEAMAAYKDILPNGGEDAAAGYAGLARVYLRQNKVEEALSAANQAMALTPGRAPAIVALGEVYYRQGKFEEAEAAFVKPIQACDLDARAFLGLYRVHAASRNMKHAKMDIDQAFKLDPNDPEIQIDHFRMETLEERIQALQNELASASDDATKDEKKKQLDGLEERKAAGKSACRLATPVKSTEAPLERLFESGQRISGFGLSMKINNVPARLLLDTGAGGILINQNLANKAGVKSMFEATIGGIGDQEEKKGKGYIGHADKIQIGGLEFDDCIVEVQSQRSVAGVDGLIGANVFRNYLVDIYMEQTKLRLSELPRLPDEAEAQTSLDSVSNVEVRWNDRYIAPEMKDYTRIYQIGHALLIPTSVNSTAPRLFMIDTGATANQLALSAAKEVTHVGRTHDYTVTGVSGEVDKVYEAENATLQFANIRQEGQNLITIDMSRISDSFGTEISGLLGLQVLYLTRIKIDYRDGLVDFKPSAQYIK
ncbi:MAG TPA: aspartyl protease family protein [Candidatus Acidoferrales bacterium]